MQRKKSYSSIKSILLKCHGCVAPWSGLKSPYPSSLTLPFGSVYFCDTYPLKVKKASLKSHLIFFYFAKRTRCASAKHAIANKDSTPPHPQVSLSARKSICSHSSFIIAICYPFFSIVQPIISAHLQIITSHLRLNFPEYYNKQVKVNGNRKKLFGQQGVGTGHRAKPQQPHPICPSSLAYTGTHSISQFS